MHVLVVIELPLYPILGDQNYSLSPPPARHLIADDLFGPALAVGGRRVDQRDPAVEGRADRVDRARLVGSAPHPAADRPGTEPDARRRKVRARGLRAIHHWSLSSSAVRPPRSRD